MGFRGLVAVEVGLPGRFAGGILESWAVVEDSFWVGFRLLDVDFEELMARTDFVFGRLLAGASLDDVRLLVGEPFASLLLDLARVCTIVAVLGAETVPRRKRA